MQKHLQRSSHTGGCSWTNFNFNYERGQRMTPRW